MTRKRSKGLTGINTTTARLADGRKVRYYYHRATGLRLPGEPGSIEFLQAYTDAEKSITNRDRGTFAGLIRAYSTSPEFDELADSTKAEYRRMLAKVEAKFGKMQEAALENPRVRRAFYEWRASVHRKSGAREGDNVLSIISAVLSWGVQNGRISHNYVSGFRRLYKADRSEIIWLPEHIAAFTQAAYLELWHAMMMGLHTGLREGDMLALTWNQYDRKRITVRPSKTKKRTGRIVSIPCTEALKEMLDNIERRNLTILTNSRGQPWTNRYFQAQWRKTMDAAGLGLDLRFNDLRGTAVTMLAEAGCTPSEMAAITGHSLKTASIILDRYQARTAHLADSAIARLENARRTKTAK